jgi:hypothetical protein
MNAARTCENRGVKLAALGVLALVACGPHGNAQPSPTTAVEPLPALSDAGASTQLVVFKPPADTVADDRTLAYGDVAIVLLDADDNPLPHESVFLAEVAENPAPDVTGVTDARGQATLSPPDWKRRTVRAVCRKGDGIFFTAPFRLWRGTRVVLHAYPSTKNIADARVVFQVAVMIEAEGTHAKVTELLRAYNLGRVAWTPRIPLPLPSGSTHFESRILSNSSLDTTLDDHGAVLFGTFAPGTHEIEITWLMPMSAVRMSFAVAMPPHVAQARVITWAGQDTRLSVAGFPSPTTEKESSGPTLVTNRTLKPDEPPIRELSIEVNHLDPAMH